MPTVGEIANEAFSNAKVLATKLDEFRTHINGLELILLRDRVMSLETLVADLKRAKEETEKRRSQYVFWGIGAIFTLASSFAVQLILFWVKK